MARPCRLLLTAALTVGLACRPAPAAEKRLVRVGDHELFLSCQGAGRPVVWFEAGLDRPGADWDGVAAAVARRTRACSYDRAGVGRSTGGRPGRTSADVVTDLERLLDAAAVQRSLILVGHSMGALHARLYASRHPGEVVGMVLVDPAPESWSRVADLLPAADRARLGRMAPMTSEGIDIAGSEALVRGVARGVAFPLAVIAAGRDDSRPLGPWTADRLAQRSAILLELQRELVAASPKGRLLVARGAGHFVHQEQPQVVIDTIFSILEQARD